MLASYFGMQHCINAAIMCSKVQMILPFFMFCILTQWFGDATYCKCFNVMQQTTNALPSLSPSGPSRLRRVHQVRQGPPLAPVRGDDQGSHRGPPGRLPQAHDLDLHLVLLQAAHLRGDGLGAVRLPAHGEAVHAAGHHQDVQHSGGPGDAQALREGGERFTLAVN